MEECWQPGSAGWNWGPWAGGLSMPCGRGAGWSGWSGCAAAQSLQNIEHMAGACAPAVMEPGRW